MISCQRWGRSRSSAAESDGLARGARSNRGVYYQGLVCFERHGLFERDTKRSRFEFEVGLDSLAGELDFDRFGRRRRVQRNFCQGQLPLSDDNFIALRVGLDRLAHTSPALRSGEEGPEVFWGVARS